jgi:hypothetical protein
MHQTLTAQFRASMNESLDAMLECAKNEILRLMSEADKHKNEGLKQVEAKRAQLEAEIQAMNKHHMADDEVVNLNVGGVNYTTCVSTLRSKPSTFLDAMFSGRYELKKVFL